MITIICIEIINGLIHDLIWLQVKIVKSLVAHSINFPFDYNLCMSKVFYLKISTRKQNNDPLLSCYLLCKNNPSNYMLNATRIVIAFITFITFIYFIFAKSSHWEQLLVCELFTKYKSKTTNNTMWT